MSQKILRTMQDDLKEIKNIKIDKGTTKKSEPEKKDIPKPIPLPTQASVSTAASKIKTPVPNVPAKTEKGHFTDIKSNLEKKGFNVSMSPLPEVKKKDEAGKDFFAKLQEKISKKKSELREQPVLKDKTQIQSQTAPQIQADAPIIDEKEVEKEEVKNEILEEVRKDEKELKDDILAQIKKQEEARKLEVQKAAEAFKAQEILKAEEAKKAEEALKAQDAKISDMLKEVSDSLNEEEIKAEESKKAILEEMRTKILEEEKKNKEDILAQIRRQEEIRSQEMQKAAQELKKQEALRAQEARALQEAIRRQEAEIANLVKKTANPLKKEDLIEEMRTKILEEEKKNKEDILAQMKMQEAQLSNFIKEVSNSLRKEAYGKEEIEKSIIAKVRAEDQKTKEDILMQVAEQEAERAGEVKKLQETIQEKDTQISNLLRGISESLNEESNEGESREKLIAEMKAKITEIEKEKKDKEDLLMQLAKESEQKREERLRIEAEEQAKKAEAEAEAAREAEEKKKQEEEAARKAAEEERIKQEAEAAQKAAEEEKLKQEAAQRIAEEEQRLKAIEEEERQKQEEEAARKAAEEERIKQEEEERLRQEEEVRAQEEAAQKEEERIRQEEEAAKEAAQRAAEEERLRQEEEAARKAEEEEKIKQEAEAAQKAAEEEKLRQIEEKLKQEEEKQAQEKAAMEQVIPEAGTRADEPKITPEPTQVLPEKKEEKTSASAAFWKSLKKNSGKSPEETVDQDVSPLKTEATAQDAQITSLIQKISNSMDAPAKSVPDQPQEVVKPDKDKDLKDLLSRMSKNLDEEEKSAPEEDTDSYSSEGYLKKNPQITQAEATESIIPPNRKTSIPDAEEDKTYWQTLHNNLREPAISPAQRLMGGTSVAVSPYDNKDPEEDAKSAGSGLTMPDEVRTAQQRILERKQAQTSYANPENRLIDGKQEFYSTMHKTIKPKLKIESLEGLDNVLKEEEVELSDEEEKKRLRQNIITKYGIKLFTFPWIRIAILTIIFLAIIGGTLTLLLPKLKNTTTQELETVTVGKSIADIDQKISAETFAKQSQVTTLNFFDANLEPWKNFDNGEIIRLNVTYDSNQDLMLSRENALKAVLGETNAAGIPDNFLKATSSEYNVLAFKESGSLRLGLVFKYTFSKEEEFKDIMADWEKTNTKSKKIYTVMKNLFVNSRIIEQDVLTFQPAMYNGTELKFVNLPDSDTSMDYFMYEGYIVFTSSKDHTFQMIDLLKS